VALIRRESRSHDHHAVLYLLRLVPFLCDGHRQLAAYKRTGEAAEARQARSALLGLAVQGRMSSRLWPLASNPSRRDTGNRRSRMQGFPVQTSGRVVIRVA
jgi:hypothetical protein